MGVKINILKILRETIYVIIVILIYEVLNYIDFKIVFEPIKEQLQPWQVLVGGIISLIIFGGILYYLHDLLDKKIKRLEEMKARP